MDTKKKLARGITLSAITVKNLDDTKRIFVDLLGLEIKDEAPEHGWLEIGGDEGTLLGVGKENDSGSDEMRQNAGDNAWVSVTVDDVVEAKAHLEANGVQVIGDIFEVPGHVKMLLFADKDGNRFWLCEKID